MEAKQLDIIISGYGRMGHEVEKQALKKGHRIVARIDEEKEWELPELQSLNKPVVIDFSVPDQAVGVYMRCFRMGLPVVSGTTGWLTRYDEVVEQCRLLNGTFLYASNFSLGVNLFFHLNEIMSSVMSRFPEYKPSMREIHHIHKLDAPSGTAITLANQIINEDKRFRDWTLEESDKNKLYIECIREGEVPGTHRVDYTSDVDKLSWKHEAYSREGFALGAVVAAEFISEKPAGVYSMKDLMKFLMKST